VFTTPTRKVKRNVPALLNLQAHIERGQRHGESHPQIVPKITYLEVSTFFDGAQSQGLA